jgi:hypothetical protein
MMSRFAGIPSLPQIGVEDWQYRILTAMKQNIELLVGTRGEQDSSSRAVVKSSVTITKAPEPTIRAVSAEGSGISISGAQVPSLADYQALVVDVQSLTNDVAQLRAAVNTLISQLRS